MLPVVIDDPCLLPQKEEIRLAYIRLSALLDPQVQRHSNPVLHSHPSVRILLLHLIAHQNHIANSLHYLQFVSVPVWSLQILWSYFLSLRWNRDSRIWKVCSALWWFPEKHKIRQVSAQKTERMAVGLEAAKQLSHRVLCQESTDDVWTGYLLQQTGVANLHAHRHSNWRSHQVLDCLAIQEQVLQYLPVFPLNRPPDVILLRGRHHRFAKLDPEPPYWVSNSLCLHFLLGRMGGSGLCSSVQWLLPFDFHLWLHTRLPIHEPRNDGRYQERVLRVFAQ